MPNWKKVITSGSDASLNTLIVSNGITGSLLGTASYASQALSSSFATTASYAFTSSYSLNPTISGSINNVDYIDFNTSSAIPAWTGTTITNGTAVRIIGAHGDIPEIERAQSVAVSGSVNELNQILGIATHDIEDNSIGYITTQGLVRGLNTNAFNDGDTLFVGTGSSGVLQNTSPRSPFEIIPIGVCVKASPGGSGIIYVAVQEPIDFSDLSSVEKSGNYEYGDLWTYTQSGSYGIWKHTNQLSGSYGITGSLTATSFTGSLLGTASYASNALSASFATSASHAPNIVEIMYFNTNATTLSDNTNYTFTTNTTLTNTINATLGIPLPIGTIVGWRCSTYWASLAGSSETGTLKLYWGSGPSEVTLSTAITWDGNRTAVFSGSLSQAITAVEPSWAFVTTPNFATNPQGVKMVLILQIEIW